jgi:hypothetical protein
MAFTSKLYPGERVVNRATNNDEIFPEGFGRGLELERRGPDGYGDAVMPFPKELLIPASEVMDWIKEIEERGLRQSELALKKKLPHKDQGQTNYCWINGPAHAIEFKRLQQNQEMVILSPASAGAPIKGFRNIGGWGLDALRYVQQYGLCPVENWPANAIDRRYFTEENKKIALNYRQTEWYSFNTEQECWSYHLRLLGISSPGYNWWRHQTSRYEPIWLDGQLAWRDRNSWANYGYNGFFILQGSKRIFDDCVAPAVVTAA